ncbi:MAG: hypothetical protein JNL08_14090 [Planctomycetes bacterium]|nr:hypothetical protein [Planctomycetota bacterium]
MVDGGDVGWLSAREERFRERFQQLLLVPNRDLAQGWQLAADVGRPAVPLLWDMLQSERSNVGRRLVLLGAALAAGGMAEDERLLAWLGQQKSMLEERTLAAMWLAEGPRRPRGVDAFVARCQGPARTPEPVLRVAVRLAAARFPGAETEDSVGPEEDPGLAAAGAFGGIAVAASLAQRLWDLRTPVRHAELFWRGALLAGARGLVGDRPVDADLLQRARERMALTGDQNAPVRAAAAWYRLRAGDLRQEGARPEWDLLQILVAESDGARRLRGWLGPVPQPRDEQPARLAVAYVLSRQPAEVVADRESWAGDARIRAHVAVALAWRLTGETDPKPIAEDLTTVPEWAFVRWASGATVQPVPALDDGPLLTAAQLMAGERLPRAALRQVLEDTLWRWGSHPGLSAWEQERLLVRDLLLVGSNTGGGKYAPHVRPTQIYRPTGIGRDDEFFTVAVALHEFLGRPRLPIPAEHRLR